MLSEELNEYWKTVVDTIQEGVMIVTPDGIIVSANNAFMRMTGYDAKELVGQPCSHLNCTSCHAERNRESHHWCRLFREGFLNAYGQRRKPAPYPEKCQCLERRQGEGYRCGRDDD